MNQRKLFFKIQERDVQPVFRGTWKFFTLAKRPVTDRFLENAFVESSKWMCSEPFTFLFIFVYIRSK